MDLKRILYTLMYLVFAVVLASADKVGVVVQYNDSVFETVCVEFSGDKTAEQILNAAGFNLETVDFPPWGAALCGINGVGCSASNCFCDSSNYWMYYYKKNGAWQYSGVGISFTEDNGYKIVQDGGVIGFRWGSWGSSINNINFEDVCGPRYQNRLKYSGDGGEIQKLEFVFNGTSGLPEIVLSKNLTFKTLVNGKTAPLIEVRLVRRVKGPLRFGEVYKSVSDFDGNVVFNSLQPGRYLLQVIGRGYIPIEKDIEVVEENVEQKNISETGAKGSEEKKNVVEEKTSMKTITNENNIIDGCYTGWSDTGWKEIGWMNRWYMR